MALLTGKPCEICLTVCVFCSFNVRRIFAYFAMFLCCLCVTCRYLIDIRWLKQWKKYVGYDEWESGMIGEETANPGPIDNSNLLEGAGGVLVCLVINIE